MPGLILEGDLEKKFGNNYPTPIINQVRVYDNYTEVDFSIFFKLPDVEEVDEFINFFNTEQDLSFFVGMPSSEIKQEVYQNLSSPKLIIGSIV